MIIARRVFMYIFAIMSLSILSVKAFAIVLVENEKSRYTIVRPVNSTDFEKRSADVLQNYLKQISGVEIPIADDSSPEKLYEILIGKTNRPEKADYTNILQDGFIIETRTEKLIITGNGRGVLYGVYTFLEEYLGCRKYTAEFKVIPSLKVISVPVIKNLQNPQFNFRSLHYNDPEKDQEYLDWHKLNRIDDKWGMWGHTFNEFVPASLYFKEHPEYFSFVDGRRQTMQLCLTNPEVLQITIKELSTRMNKAPATQIYWSVSQNDDIGGCECENCSALNDKYESPQGSLLSFVNQVASHFPDKIISTLAYTYTRKPPVGLKPLENVNIMFSSIEINRSKPLVSDPRSASVRKDYENWKKLTNNIIVWDYVVQFTNYISPFPNMNTLKPNLEYFASDITGGFFIQGSVETAGEFSELKAYLLSKLLWDPATDLEKLKIEFLNAYYGEAGKYIAEYIELLHKNIATKSGRRLDIYDNPVMPYNSYLSPQQTTIYSSILTKAADAVKNNPEHLKRALSVRLPLEYTVLQQARFYGIEQFGVFIYDGKNWSIRPEIQLKRDYFFRMLKELGIKQLNESGLTPDEYNTEWTELFKEGPKIHKALNKPVTLLTPNENEFTSKGPRTLVDGTAGSPDFQYNWLGWLGNNMEVRVDMEERVKINKVSISFLENHRHNMFLPREILLEISNDGKEYKKVSVIKNADPREGTKTSVKEYTFELPDNKGRYIKVTAINQTELPKWRPRRDRKPWLLIDEIIIE